MVQGKSFKRRPKKIIDEFCIACPSLFGNYGEGTQASYAEIAMMAPTDLGWIEIDIDRNGDVSCAREINEAGQTVDEVESSYVR